MQHLHFDELPSSNDYAKAHFREFDDLTFVSTSYQSAGKGRLGRRWSAHKGENLLFSIAIKNRPMIDSGPFLSLVAAVAVTSALEEEYGVHASIKWPNDVWLNGRKLCGILSTMSCMATKTEYAVIGIGINVNMREFPEDIPGTSLAQETDHEFSRAEILASVLNAIEEDYSLWKNNQTLASFMERWAACSLLDGRTITAEHGRNTLQGIACGITPDGLLKLNCPDGVTRLIAAGDTHIIL